MNITGAERILAEFGSAGDPVYWRPTALVRRAIRWSRATRRRRRTTTISGILFALFVFPGLLGVFAAADSAGGATGNSGLSWMDVKDSSGVDLSSYLMALNQGNILHPLTSGMALIIELEFAGWLMIVTTGIWLIGYVLGFTWLNLIATPLHALGQNLVGELHLPIVLTTAVTIGAFFVAWFVLRGMHAKAAMQVFTMFVLVVIGGLFLADPLADVLSSDGWLAQGRDLGISVAAGLNGNSNPNAQQLIPQLQGELADNFARKPLEVWNFGHVIDNEPGCSTAWSAQVAAGSSDGVRSAMQSCGDSAAYAATDNPGVGQIGAGLLLLVAGTLLLAFGAFLAIRIVKSALDCIYFGLASVFGLLFGGYIYGPTQTFLVRCIVHSFFAAGKMAAEILFLGIYVLFLGDLFQQANGQVMAVFVIGAVVEIIAIRQSSKLSKTLEKGNDWVANRLALSIESGGVFAPVGAGGGGGGGGGYALGMGESRSGGHGLGFLATMAAMNTLNSNAAVDRLFGRSDPFGPKSKYRWESELSQMGMYYPGTSDLGGPLGSYVMNTMHRTAHKEEVAQRRVERAGRGLSEREEAAWAIHDVLDVGGGVMDAYAAMIANGFDPEVARMATESFTLPDKFYSRFKVADPTVSSMLATTARTATLRDGMLGGGNGREPEKYAAILAAHKARGYEAWRAHRAPVDLVGGASGDQQDWVNRFVAAPSAAGIAELKAVIDGPSTTLTDKSGVAFTLGSDDARRMWKAVGRSHVQDMYDNINKFNGDPRNAAGWKDVESAQFRYHEMERFAKGKLDSPLTYSAPPL